MAAVYRWPPPENGIPFTMAAAYLMAGMRAGTARSRLARSTHTHIRTHAQRVAAFPDAALP